MSSNKTATIIVAAVCGVALSAMPSYGASANWSAFGTATANWSNGSTWVGGIPADGAGFTAGLIGVDISSDKTVTLDTNRTIGNITFTDKINAPNPSSNDATIGVSGGSILTLDVTSGSPTINVTQAERKLTINPVIAGNDGLTKTGPGLLILTGANTYTGTTTVTNGRLYVTGSLSSAVTVGASGKIGRNTATNGGLGNGLTISAGGDLDLTGATLGVSSTGILGITGGSLTLGNLTFEDLIGWDWANASVGTYKLIDGAFSIDFGSTAYVDEASAYDFGNGKKGYFTSGSLNAVIVPIPEPASLVLLCLGGLMMIKRRKA